MANASTQRNGGSVDTPSSAAQSTASQRDLGPRDEPRYWNALAWITSGEGAGAGEGHDADPSTDADPGSRPS